jgi:hypothetical protein
MNRRDAISRVALLLGGTLSAPTLTMMSCQQKNSESAVSLANFSLTDTQRQIVAAVAEAIIPRTDTPGAIDAGVPAFIELMLKDCYKQLEQESFMEGVEALQKKDFLKQNKEQQTATLKQLETETKELMKALEVKKEKVGDNVDKETVDADKKGVPFWRLMKELTLLGYFTSKEGVNASFDYQPIPGKLVNIKVKPNQKAVMY